MDDTGQLVVNADAIDKKLLTIKISCIYFAKRWIPLVYVRPTVL
jgi:hypothetical protein